MFRELVLDVLALVVLAAALGAACRGSEPSPQARARAAVAVALALREVPPPPAPPREKVCDCSPACTCGCAGGQPCTCPRESARPLGTAPQPVRYLPPPAVYRIAPAPPAFTLPAYSSPAVPQVLSAPRATANC